MEFTRQLGEESGTQLNPLVDESTLPTTMNEDQVIATVGRFNRGRIDKPFVVTRGSFKRMLGKGESIRSNMLNETYVQIFEALQKGAKAVVVQRLVSLNGAGIGWAYIKDDSEVGFTSGKTDLDIAIDPESNEFEAIEVGSSILTVSGNSFSYFLAVKHLECFSEGIMLEIHADELLDDDGFEIDNDFITLRVLDSYGVKLFEFAGSLDEDAYDENGKSLFIGDVVQSKTDLVQVQISANVSVGAGSNAYGYDDNGSQKWYRTPVIKTYEEFATGSEVTSYFNDDYHFAADALAKTKIPFGYMSTGASNNVALIKALAYTSYQLNTPLAVDIYGEAPALAVLQFMNELNLSAADENHLIWTYWCPVKSDCPAGINPRGYFGTSMYILARACLRNSVKNRYGISAKNFPIAGSDNPINRTNMTQTRPISAPNLSRLAKYRVNPVVFKTFSDRSSVVPIDSLTSSPQNSLKKLTSVADMASWIDRQVLRFANQVLQKPMSVAIKATNEFMLDLFERVESSGWLVPSEDPQMDGKTFKYGAYPDPSNPYDKMIYAYSLHYDGVARQIEVTQTVSK
jgi:hypothetical protein